MTEAAQRFDRIASNYGQSEVHQSSPTLTRLHELVKLPPQASVCDVACGAGHLALSFGDLARTIVGVDPAPSMLDQFQQLAVARGLEVRAVNAFSEEVPLPSDSFEFVGSRLAPHHFMNVQQAVLEMARLAKPGGYVAVIDLEGFEEPSVDAFNHGLEVLHDPTHVRSYTAREWQAFFARAQLRVEVVESDRSERPVGVPVRRWCEIASSGAEAEAEIRRRLAAAPAELLNALRIRRGADDFLMPVRTVLIVARKPLRP